MAELLPGVAAQACPGGSISWARESRTAGSPDPVGQRSLERSTAVDTSRFVGPGPLPGEPHHIAPEEGTSTVPPRLLCVQAYIRGGRRKDRGYGCVHRRPATPPDARAAEGTPTTGGSHA
jgi:hypothetical protein